MTAFNLESQSQKQQKQNQADRGLVNRAIREGWPISAEHKSKAVNMLIAILLNPETTTKEILRAIKTLGELDSLNVRRQQIEEMNKPKHLIVTDLSTEQIISRLKERLSDLGYGESTINRLDMVAGENKFLDQT